jgi:DNA repair protein RadD
LGFVSDIVHEELDDGKIRERKPRDNIKLPKECPRCAYLRPAGTNKCPNCGFEARPVSNVRVVDGELHELNGKKKRPIINRGEVCGMFKQICIERGKKPGYAWHLSTEYFGQKPPSSEYSNAQPTRPTIEILRWEKSRRIAWAKAHPRPSLTLASSAVPIGGFYVNHNPEDVPF